MKIIKIKKTHKSPLNKLLFTVFGVIFAVAAPILILNSTAYAVANAQNTYTNVNMPSSNLTDISEDLTINNVTSLGSADFFWSHQFGFSGSEVPTAGGAYIGLQGINRAIFSVFDYASTEASSDCTVSQNGFDGYTGESGTSCILSYTVTQGHTYRLQVANKGQDSQGVNWLGTVTDLTTEQTTDIATINVALGWGNLASGSSVWTEWFGAAPSSCSALPYSNVTFSNFTANNDQYTSPSSTSDSLQTDTGCSGYSQIVDTSNNSFNQIMGIDPPITNTIVPFNPPATPSPITTTTAPTSTNTLTPTKPSKTTSNIKTSNKVEKPSRNLKKIYIDGGIIIIILILGSVLLARFLLRK
ncbi:MAG TPA: hypothetical protein VMQ58_03355, partial [Candidatus Saccharimonadales bacterium]|nr:hypothetical protein [Candidatus Saccharimonadales bacterium]